MASSSSLSSSFSSFFSSVNPRHFHLLRFYFRLLEIPVSSSNNKVAFPISTFCCFSQRKFFSKFSNSFSFNSFFSSFSSSSRPSFSSSSSYSSSFVPSSSVSSSSFSASFSSSFFSPFSSSSFSSSSFGISAAGVSFPSCGSLGVNLSSSSSCVSSPHSILLEMPFFLNQRRFSKHPYKPKSRAIFHPHIPGPEHLPSPSCFKANLSQMQTFIPEGYYNQMKVEALRSGQYNGEDAPYNLIPNWRLWKRRKYNVECNTIPWRESEVKAVLYYERLNMWAVQWKEDGVHRIRRFKGAYGLKRGRLAAEKFRQDLEACGRVDNRRSERQLRFQQIKKSAERDLRKKRFKRISSGQF